MAGSIEGAGFWLPSEFLTDDDFLMDKHYFSKSSKANSDSYFSFPYEYDFPTRALQLDRLQKLLGLPALRPWCGAGNGSPNGVLSPPMTPLPDAAAGQVANLKLNGAGGFVPEQKVLFAHPRTHSQQNMMNPSLLMPLHKQLTNENSGVWNSQNRGMVEAGKDRTALWGIYRGGGCPAPAKRPCAGTGVFLPRRYGSDGDSKSHLSDAHKKPGCSPALFPVACPNGQIKKFNNINILPRPHRPHVFAPDYGRHAALLQRQGSLLASLMEERHDAYLPHEWTY